MKVTKILVFVFSAICTATAFAIEPTQVIQPLPTVLNRDCSCEWKGQSNFIVDVRLSVLISNGKIASDVIATFNEADSDKNLAACEQYTKERSICKN